MEEKISIENLNLYYSDFQALKDINIKIPKNKITALIGPSGCGKSSFLKLLNRMNDLVEGTKIEGKIIIDNENIYDKDTNIVELRTKVGMVFQKPNPFAMSIYDNVALAPKKHGIRDKKLLDQMVETSLRKAALWDEVKDKLHESALKLSGGQQQRLCIARTLVVEPEIILFDEPTSALDPIATAKIEDLLSELKKEYTIVIVTHSMKQAARISDLTAFFLLGELIEFSKTQEMFTRPRNSKTDDYISGRFG